MAGAGARVGLCARRAAELEAVATEIRAGGGQALALPCDVGEREQVAAAAERALAELGPIDGLVNNAGYGGHRSFLEWEVGDIERMMRVNFLGAVYWTKELLPQMVDRHSGWLLFMSSVAGRIGVPGESAYAASKFAMTGLAEALSIEVEEHGVHVLTVYPGAIDTDFFDEEALQRMPATAKRMMVEAPGLADAIIDALRRGKRELTYPRAIAAGYVVRAVAPGFMRANVKRTTQG